VLQWEIVFLDTLFESEDGRWLWEGVWKGAEEHSDTNWRATPLNTKQY